LQFPGVAKLLHHSPNGGRRNAREAARFKAMGTRAGFPDLILLLARPPYNYLAVELKTEVGRQRDSQKDFQRLMSEHGGRYVVIRSVEDFIQEVTNYIQPRKLFDD
jgi:hypothetical protein